VKRYADEVRRTEGIPFQIRVALNSGEVVVRSVGSDLHMDYTAVGQTPHLAARMEQIADPGAVVIMPDVDEMVLLRPSPFGASQRRVIIPIPGGGTRIALKRVSLRGPPNAAGDQSSFINATMSASSWGVSVRPPALFIPVLS
jgi:class 3 adenylate cyclase